MITENKLSKDELIKLYNSDLDDLLKLSSKYIKDTCLLYTSDAADE